MSIGVPPHDVSMKRLGKKIGKKSARKKAGPKRARLEVLAT
jgi:hypothetical protein